MTSYLLTVSAQLTMKGQKDQKVFSASLSEAFKRAHKVVWIRKRHWSFRHFSCHFHLGYLDKKVWIEEKNGMSPGWFHHLCTSTTIVKQDLLFFFSWQTVNLAMWGSFHLANSHIMSGGSLSDFWDKMGAMNLGSGPFTIPVSGPLYIRCTA